MFLSKAKYNELIKSVDDAALSVEQAKKTNQKLEDQLKALDKARREAIEKAAVNKENVVKWVNEYVADDFKFITNNKLRAFVASQIATELGTPMPTEFTTDIADENLERINHILYTAITLDSYLGAEGLTIRKK